MRKKGLGGHSEKNSDDKLGLKVTDVVKSKSRSDWKYFIALARTQNYSFSKFKYGDICKSKLR